MPHAARARVFMSGRSQHVTIPAEYRFSAEEVFVRRDPRSGDLILSQSPGGWNEFFAALDADPFPDDFLADRAQGIAETREEL
jgi:antitoxin VapB